MNPRLGVILLLCGLLVGCREDPSAAAPEPATVTASVTYTLSATPPIIPSATPTRTPTATPSATITSTPTHTATLATRVVMATAVMAGVGVAYQHGPTATPSQPTIPPPIDPLPDATHTTSRLGWYTYESDHPAIRYRGIWSPMGADGASRGQYHYSVDPQGHLEFAFRGQAVRVRYVCFWNGGQWALWVDGQHYMTVDSYADHAQFGTTDVIALDGDEHLLEIRLTGEAQGASSDIMMGVDAIDVYQVDPTALTVTPAASHTPWPTPQDAAAIEMLQGAPTVQATSTPQPPTVIDVALIIAYDENANRAVDPAEGVRGIPVRLVEVGTNRVITQGYTDAAGYAELQAISNQGVRLVAPYFGAYWDVRRTDGQQTYTLLLPPGNQPGLIP